MYYLAVNGNGNGNGNVDGLFDFILEIQNFFVLFNSSSITGVVIKNISSYAQFPLRYNS